MEVVELLGVSYVDCLGLTGIEGSGENHCMIDLQLGGETESLSFIPTHSHRVFQKVALAFATLFFTSNSMFTPHERVQSR